MRIKRHNGNQGRRSAVYPELFVRGLAKDLDIDPGHLSRILRGIGDPSMDLALRIAEAMDVTVDELIELLRSRRNSATLATVRDSPMKRRIVRNAKKTANRTKQPKPKPKTVKSLL